MIRACACQLASSYVTACLLARLSHCAWSSCIRLRWSDRLLAWFLQVLHLTKKHAYFPEQRRMAESSIAVPFSAEAAARLAAGCQKLRSLRLCLGRNDVAAEGLAELKHFSNLRRWALVAVQKCSYVMSCTCWLLLRSRMRCSTCLARLYQLPGCMLHFSLLHFMCLHSGAAWQSQYCCLVGACSQPFCEC